MDWLHVNFVGMPKNTLQLNTWVTETYLASMVQIYNYSCKLGMSSMPMIASIDRITTIPKLYVGKVFFFFKSI